MPGMPPNTDIFCINQAGNHKNKGDGSIVPARQPQPWTPMMARGSHIALLLGSTPQSCHGDNDSSLPEQGVISLQEQRRVTHVADNREGKSA